MNNVLSIFASDEDHVRKEKLFSLHMCSNIIDREDNTREKHTVHLIGITPFNIFWLVSLNI